jgi:hypothetical protein
MPYYKVFAKKLTKKNVGSLDTEAPAYTKYLIAFAASGSEMFEAVTVQRRVDDSKPYTIIASNLKSEYAQLGIELGYFTPGDQIDIFWIITAVSKVAAMAAYIINDSTKVVRKISPVSGTKALAKGEDWAEEVVNFKLF